MPDSMNFVAARLMQSQEAKLAEASLQLLQYVDDPLEAALVFVRPEGEWPVAVALHGESGAGDWKARPELHQYFGVRDKDLLAVPAWMAYCAAADLHLAVASLAAKLGTDAAHLYFSEDGAGSGFSLFGADGGLRETFSYGVGGGNALLRYKQTRLRVQELPRDMLPFDPATPFFEGLARFFGIDQEDSQVNLDFLEDVYSPETCTIREYSLVESGEKLAIPELRE